MSSARLSNASATREKYDSYRSLRVHVDRGVAFVTIDHKPINLFDQSMLLDIARLGAELDGDSRVRVAVFWSDDPDFFIAHADLKILRSLPPLQGKSEKLGLIHTVMERFRTMSTITIAAIEGCARGAGSEFALSLDMRFAARETARLSQMEVALGTSPGAGGTQRLPRLVGRGRALEIILGCEDFSADEAERYGYINRALPAGELRTFVSDLAHRIASFPELGLALAKRSVNAAEGDWNDGLLEEARCFQESAASPAASRRITRLLELGAQTRERELRLDRLIDELGNGV